MSLHFSPALTFRAMLLTASLLGVVSTGCGDEDDNESYLGAVEPVDAAIEPDSGSETQAIALEDLQPKRCAFAPLPLSEQATVESLAVRRGRALVATDDGVFVLRLGADGCPEGLERRIVPEENKAQGTVLGAVGLSSNRTVVATEHAFLLYDGSGKELKGCEEQLPSPPRLLCSSGDSGWMSSFRGKVLRSYQAPVDLGGKCKADTRLELTPSPFVATALAATPDGGWVTLQQATANSPIRLARYDASGKLIAQSRETNPDQSDHLCAGTAVAATDQGMWVADGACGKIVLFHKNMIPMAAARMEGIPLGVAWVESAERALVAIHRTKNDRAVVEFVTIEPDGS